MTCLDANYFLRALIEPKSSQAKRQHHQAVALFEAPSRGEVDLTATEVAIHEALFILTAKVEKNGYGLGPAEACLRLRVLIDMPGFKHPQKRVILQALGVWSDHPSLGFSDSLTTAYAQHHQFSLTSFDTDFDAFPQLTRYRPAA